MQSDQGLHCLLTESLDITECMNRAEQMSGWYFAHVQDDLNLLIMFLFEGTFFFAWGGSVASQCYYLVIFRDSIWRSNPVFREKQTSITSLSAVFVWSVLQVDPFMSSGLFYHNSLHQCVSYSRMSDYCPFDITLKDVFCLAFHFKWKYFVLIDHTLSETICLFCFCVLFSNIYPKNKFMAKIVSDLCNFYSKVIFCFTFCLRKYFLLLFAEFELLMFPNNIVKLSKKWTSKTCWKSSLKLPTLQVSALIAFIFTMGKVKIFNLLKIND